MKRTPQVRSGLDIDPFKACIRNNKSKTKKPNKHIVCSKCGELARVYYMRVSLYSIGCGRKAILEWNLIFALFLFPSKQR